MPSVRASIRALVAASGVRRSWETAAMRSRRAFSISRSAAFLSALAMRLKSSARPATSSWPSTLTSEPSWPPAIRAVPARPLDAARQRPRAQQAEADREGRRESQHRQEQREVVSRDEHGSRAGQHHPEEQEAADQICPDKLRPHAAETPEHGGADEEQRQQTASSAGHSEQHRYGWQIRRRHAE